MSLPDVQTLAQALSDYAAVVDRQGVSRLAELDSWYRSELPAEIHERDPAHVTLSELARLTEWKMARGVWRGRNLALVRSNDEAEVKEVSTAALSEIPHPTRPISRLAALKGVGPATASAAVAAASPEVYPFFDEIVAAQLVELGPVKWTLTYYRRYADALREAAQELGGDWTPVRLEQALWAHAGGKAGAAGTG